MADSRARVIGINTALVGPMVGQGLGLAVPIDDSTKRIVESLVRDGRVRRAYLGVAGGSRPLPPRIARVVDQDHGVEVVEVVSGSPADLAGVRPGDIIIEGGGMAVEDVSDLQALMTGDLIDSTLELDLVRSGEVRRVTCRPVELADS